MFTAPKRPGAIAGEPKSTNLEGETMDEQDREEVALFRYGLIAPLLHGGVEDRGE